MKSGKKIVGLLLVVTAMVFCLAGCMKADMGVVIKEDGTASLTSKLFIEEEAYNTLLSFSSEGDEVSVEGDLDLSKFKKETVDDKVYYTFEETKQFDSYDDLEKALMSNGDEADTNVFSDVEVKKSSDGEYTFKLVTMPMDASDVSMAGSDDWLKVSMTVTLPGKVVETNGETVDKDTVKFVIDNFSESKTYSVTSEPITLGAKEIALCVAFVAIIAGTIVFVVIRRKKGYRI